MGIKGIGEIEAFLDAIFTQSSYPRKMTAEELRQVRQALESEPIGQQAQIEDENLADIMIPADLSGLDYFIDDANGRRLRVAVTPVITAEDGTRKPGVFLSREDRTRFSPDGALYQMDDSLTTYGQLAERFYAAYDRYFALENVKVGVVMFDHIGKTPRAKEIHYREHRYTKPRTPVYWPPGGELVHMDAPFYNDIGDIYADEKARRQFLSFMTWYGLTEYPKKINGMRAGQTIVLAGGYDEHGRKMETPRYASITKENQVDIGDYTDKVAGKPCYFFCSEADTSITSWIIHFGAESNVLVQSQDGDVETILYVRMQDRIRALGSFDRAGRIWLCRRKSASTSPGSDEEQSASSSEDVQKPAAVDSDLPSFPDDEFIATAAKTDSSPGNGKKRSSSTDSLGGSTDVSPGGGGKRQRTASSKSRDDRTVTYVDMKERYQGVFNTFLKLQKEHELSPAKHTHPVELFVTLCFMLNKDYLHPLPGISFKTIITTIFQHIDVIGRLVDTVAIDNDDEEARNPDCDTHLEADPCHRARVFRVHYAALERFVVELYRERYSLAPSNWDKKRKALIASLNKRKREGDTTITEEEHFALLRGPYPHLALSSASGVLSFLRKYHPAMNKQFPPENLRVFAANLAWLLNYYTQAGKAEFKLPSEFQVDGQSRSRYGYELIVEQDSVVRTKENIAILDVY